jgi:hypothetical protein
MSCGTPRRRSRRSVRWCRARRVVVLRRRVAKDLAIEDRGASGQLGLSFTESRLGRARQAQRVDHLPPAAAPCPHAPDRARPPAPPGHQSNQSPTCRGRSGGERACRNVGAFLHGLRLSAEQSTPTQRWYRILSRARRKYLRDRQLHPPDACRRRPEPAAAARSRIVHSNLPGHSPAEGFRCSFWDQPPAP